VQFHGFLELHKSYESNLSTLSKRTIGLTSFYETYDLWSHNADEYPLNLAPKLDIGLPMLGDVQMESSPGTEDNGDQRGRQNTKSTALARFWMPFRGEIGRRAPYGIPHSL
jgi:hypothetical protein